MIVKNDRVYGMLDIIVRAITFVVAAWMMVWVVKYLAWSIERRPHSLELQMPLYYVHAAMAVGMVLMTFYFLIDFVSAVLCPARNRPSGENPGGSA
jgi:TRAP-type C4-dicarboxylate transport system permease small subunit